MFPHHDACLGRYGKVGKKMKNRKIVFSHNQAVILFLMMTVTLHVLGLKIYCLIKGTSLITAYLDYGSKILGVILLGEMLLLSYLSPLKFNRDALHWYSKDKLKYFYISIAIALLVIAGFLGFRLYMNAKNPLYQEIPMFGLYLNIHTRWFYPINIVFQELFIKAFTQENIAVALQDTDKKDRSDYERKHAFLTAFITAVFFFVLHLQYELYYMTGAFLLCFITGLLYEKDRNIWGAVIVHIAVGFLPRCFGILQIIEGVW